MAKKKKKEAVKGLYILKKDNVYFIGSDWYNKPQYNKEQNKAKIFTLDTLAKYVADNFKCEVIKL